MSILLGLAVVNRDGSDWTGASASPGNRGAVLRPRAALVPAPLRTRYAGARGERCPRRGADGVHVGSARCTATGWRTGTKEHRPPRPGPRDLDRGLPDVHPILSPEQPRRVGRAAGDPRHRLLAGRDTGDHGRRGHGRRAALPPVFNPISTLIVTFDEAQAVGASGRLVGLVGLARCRQPSRSQVTPGARDAALVGRGLHFSYDEGHSVVRGVARGGTRPPGGRRRFVGRGQVDPGRHRGGALTPQLGSVPLGASTGAEMPEPAESRSSARRCTFSRVRSRRPDAGDPAATDAEVQKALSAVGARESVGRCRRGRHSRRRRR